MTHHDQILFCALLVIVAIGFWCMGYQFAGARYFSEWKRGFDKGYEMGISHGKESARFQTWRKSA